MNCKGEKSYWLQDIHKSHMLRGALGGILLILFIAYLFYGSVLAALVLSPGLAIYMKGWIRRQIEKKKAEFRLQFKEAIQAMSASLQVGYSAENAMKEALIDLKLIYPKDAQIIREFQFMIHQLEMNLSVEQSFIELGKRTGEEEVQMFATVFALSKRSGADTIEIIRNAVWQIGEKIEVKHEIETMLTAKKMEFRVMSLVPFGMIGYMKVAFPHFLNALYGNLFGIVMMSVCLFIYAGAYAWGNHIMEIEV